MANPDLLDCRGVAALLTVSVPTVRRMVRRGELVAPFRVSARRVRWRRAAVLEWLNTRPAIAATG